MKLTLQNLYVSAPAFFLCSDETNDNTQLHYFFPFLYSIEWLRAEDRRQCREWEVARTGQWVVSGGS